jgi:hypothetical protein
MCRHSLQLISPTAIQHETIALSTGRHGRDHARELCSRVRGRCREKGPETKSGLARSGVQKEGDVQVCGRKESEIGGQSDKKDREKIAAPAEEEANGRGQVG